MFRDLKEYQEIAKIYTEKVSKPENLDERVRGGGVSSAPKIEPTTPPQKGAGGGVGNPTNVRGTGAGTVKPIVRGAQGRTKRPQPEIKKFPSTAEIRAKSDRVGGGNAGASTDSGGTSQSTIKSVEQKSDSTSQTKPKMGSPDSKFIKKDKGVGFVKRGTPGAQRAENKEKAKLRAQAMAKARIAAKKKAEMSEGMAGALIKGGSKLVPALMTGIGAVGTMMQSKKKQGTKGGGQGFGGEKPANAEVKAPKKEKKPRLNIGKRMSGRDRNYAQSMETGMESVEYDAYDLVLEYLISTEQAATIEEANYVMTEMDAETIQSIVEEQKKNLEEGLPLLAKGAAVVGGMVLAKKGLDKAKQKFDNFINKKRDEGGGGNTRPGADKIYFGDKKKK